MFQANFGSIYLIGPTCVGKSVVGSKLATQLDRDFIDLDEFISQHTGVDIQTIFDYEGESGFRRHESRCLHKVADQSAVIALGAGCVLAVENQALIKSSQVVYLACDLAFLVNRIERSNQRHRPLLKGTESSRLEEIKRMYTMRTPIYTDLATINVEVAGKSVSQICREIKTGLRLQ